jgi:hypothetical protein
MTRAKRNLRSLTVIADRINALERTNIIEIGNLLNEAKAQLVEHGQWLKWLGSEFSWFSHDTASRCMAVAAVADKFRRLRNLKLAKVTLYALAEHEDKADLPAIVAALAKHANKKRLLPSEAARIINLAIGRRHYGDLPEATLCALVTVITNNRRGKMRDAMVAALRKAKPETEEAVNKIIEDAREAELEAIWDEDEVNVESETDDAEKKADDPEAVAILEGPPPVLPSSDDDGKPLRLRANEDESWPEQDAFRSAVNQLHAIRTKPLARFIDTFEPNELRDVIDFLSAIVRAKEKQTESA